MLKAAVFDLDGTLIDSGRLHFQAFQKAVDDMYGIDYFWEDFAPLYGRSAEAIIKPFLEKNGLDLSSSKEFADNRRDTLKKILEGMDSIPLLDGAIEILEKFRENGFKMALATGNRKNTGELMVEKAGLKKYFPVRLFHEDVSHGKPDPEMFQKAAEQMGEQPKDCIVFEDSVYGVKAGKNSGMIVVAVATGSQTSADLEELMPELVLNSLSEFSFEILGKNGV